MVIKLGIRPMTNTKFSAKAHIRPNYSYSAFHKSLLHENNAEDYALRHIYSLENTKALLKTWGWTEEQVRAGIDHATIDVYKHQVYLHIPGKIEKRGAVVKIRGISRYISKADYVNTLVKRCWDKADPYKLVPGNDWDELISKGMGDEFYELQLLPYSVTCTCHAYSGIEKAFLQDAIAQRALQNNEIVVGQVPDKHVFAVWKYLGATNQREYEHCWINRRDAAIAEDQKWQFEPEPEPELADW
jgi:hypothetical protein